MSSTFARLRLGFVAIVALSGMLAVGKLTDAQEADPLAGVTVQSIGMVEPADNPGQALVLLRLTLEPGVTIAEHHHPGAVALYVESGEFTTTFTMGSGLVTRAASAGTPVPEEPIELGKDLVLNPGDAVSYDQDSHHIMRNTGSEPLVLLASGILAADQPGFLFADASS
jgi:mannose-6-phosphate isomerase-like protein (cupin superfamily)